MFDLTQIKDWLGVIAVGAGVIGAYFKLKSKADSNEKEIEEVRAEARGAILKLESNLEKQRAEDQSRVDKSLDEIKGMQRQILDFLIKGDKK